MFSSARTSTLRQRTLDALGLARSFLLLEDDTEVDWEVGQDEWTGVDHPHRAALRSRAIERRLARRRPGEGTPREQVCVSPVGRPVAPTPERTASTPERTAYTAQRLGATH